jgi:hypothetical protein
MTRNSFRRFAAAAVAAAAVAAGGNILAAEATAHRHEAGAPHRLALDHGKKWATDESLRLGMSRVRDALATRLGGIRSGKLKPDEYAALATEVEAQVAFMVQNCKLDPAADENLHLIIAEMATGIDAIRGKPARTGPRRGAMKVVKALGDYGRYFDHPGWTGLMS